MVAAMGGGEVEMPYWMLPLIMQAFLCVPVFVIIILYLYDSRFIQRVMEEMVKISSFFLNDPVSF